MFFKHKQVDRIITTPPGAKMAKPTDKELIQLMRQSQKLRLIDIRLVESHCKLGTMKEGALPPTAHQAIALNVQADLAKKLVVAIVNFNLICVYDDSDTANPPVLITAKFGLQYTYNKPISKNQLEKIVRNIAMVNVWPFWREFAQSTSVRMGLPAFPMPLMNPANLVLKKTEPVEEKEV